jgi:hypothetical protein
MIRRPMIAALLALAAASQAQPRGRGIAPPELLPAEARDYRLDGPYLHAAEPRSMDLAAADVNGDGLLDIVSVANDKGFLELRLRTREGEERLVRETLPLDGVIRSILPADVDGDGRTDILATRGNGPVSVFYQDGKGRLAPAERTKLEGDVAFAADVNADGRADVLLYSRGKFQLLRAKARGISLEPAATFYTVYEPASQPMVLDLDRDGRVDIAYQNAGARDQIVVRFQGADGSFPTETLIPIGPVRDVAAASLPGTGDVIAAIPAQTRSLVMMSLAEPAAAERDELRPSAPFVTAFDPQTRPEKLRTLLSDPDGDGRADLLVAAPETPWLLRFSLTREGTFTYSKTASLQGVEALGDAGSGKGAAPTFLFSTREKAIGLCAATKPGQDMPFPDLVPASKELRAATIARVAGKPHIVAVPAGAAGTLLAWPVEKGAAGKETSIAVAEGTDIKATGLAAIDLNGDAQDDLLVFEDFKPAALWMQQKDGTFRATRASGLDGLLNDLKPEQVRPVRLEGSDRPLALVAKERFARAVTLNDSGAADVAEQFNGAAANSRIVAAAGGAFRGPKRRDVALLDMGTREVVYFGLGGSGRYEQVAKAPLDNGDYRALDVLDVDGDGRDDVLLTAPDRLAVIHSRELAGPLRAVASAKPVEEKGRFGAVWTAQVLPGGAPEIIALDQAGIMLEFFCAAKSRTGTPELQRFYAFKVFDLESSLAERIDTDAPPEPREIIAAEMDEKAAPTIFALTHDKLLRFERKAAAPESPKR